MRKMKKTLTMICAAVCVIALLAGCTRGYHGTLDEPELTVSYLTGEYAAQLINDGARVLFGTIDLTEREDGTRLVNIREKEHVEDPDDPRGFYIADRNLESTYELSEEARATFIPRGERVAQAMDYETFVDAVWLEFFENNIEHQDYQLYDIYIMGDEVLLFIARYFP